MNMLVVAGTRPEVIKLAPVVLEAQQRSGIDVRLVLTGQHQVLAAEALHLFGLKADQDLHVMRPDQSPVGVMASVMQALGPVFQEHRPDVAVVQGDTTSAAAAAIAAFHANIPVAHVEAGLRTHDLSSPFPEEANRRWIGVVASDHFCPTTAAADHLRREGVADDRIHVTGNSIVDAMRLIRERHAVDDLRSVHPGLHGPLVLVTAHRRESFGDGIARICEAVRRCAAERPDLTFVYPVHPNPRVHGPVHGSLSGIRNVVLLPPVPYLALLTLLHHAPVVMTDSGGIQEEAPSFGSYCVVMREHTERAEGIAAGVAELAGTDTDAIVRAVLGALRRGPGTITANPYGDGAAARRMVDLLLRRHG